MEEYYSLIIDPDTQPQHDSIIWQRPKIYRVGRLINSRIGLIG